MRISQRGFSVVGSLLGFSLLGLSTIGLATYMGSFEEVKVSYTQSANVQFMHSELLSSMEKIFTMTSINANNPAAPSSKNEYGLCAVVTDSRNNNTYARFKDKTICPIHLKAASINLAANYKDGSKERFKYFVEEGQNWTLSSGKCDEGAQENNQNINGFVDNFPDGAFHKCFKYQSETGADHIYARLVIEPQKMPLFKKINSGSVLVDELAYKLRSVISTRKELESGEYAFSMSQNAKYLWAAEVLDCHVCNSTECKLARFSSSAQGTASRHSKICYHSMYALKEKKDALALVAEKTAVRINKPAGSLVREDSNHSAVCRYNLFKCGGVSNRDKRDFDPTLNFRFLLNYDQPEDSSIREVNLQVTDGTTVNTFKHGTLLTPADQKARVARKKNSTLISFGEGDWPLKAGGNEVKAFMADQNTSGSSMCKKICDGSAPSFYPKLTVKYGDANCDGGSQCSKTETFNNRKVACSWCNAKSCHSSAPNTYKQQKPEENPKDDLIGECTLSSSSMSGLSDSSISVSSLSDQRKKCLKYENGSYSLEACNNKMLAGEKWNDFAEERQLLGKKGANGVWTAGILSSLSIAYNTFPGNIFNLLKNQKLSKTSDENKYMFHNYSQTLMMGHSLFPHYIMQRDASGMFHAGWLNVFYPEDAVDRSLADEDKARWAYFYREPFKSIDFEDKNRVGGTNSGDPAIPSLGGSNDTENKQIFLGRVRPARPVYMKMSHDFYPRASNRLVLVHHMAFKGITFGSFQSFLCRNINAQKYSQAFVTTTASIGDGYRECRDLGSNWYFIPPDTKELLSSALLAVAPNAPRYPFPNPFKFPDGIPFWRALKSDGETDENGQAYNSKMRRWKLSYKYADMSANSYKESFASDQEVFFNDERGVLRQPSSSALGGLIVANSSGCSGYTSDTIINYRVAAGDITRGFPAGACLACRISARAAWQTCIGSKTPEKIRKCVKRGLDPCSVVRSAGNAVFRESWNFRPDWPNILVGSYDLTSDPLETGSTYSLLFNMESSETAELARLQSDITALDNDTNINTSGGNIGAINYNGRIMTYRSLRESGDLSHFNTKAVKLCRYSKNENHIDFHKALIFVGSPSNWPSTDSCQNYTASNSQSFLASNAQGPDKIYYKIPSSPGSGNLKNLTKNDFLEIRKGIRTIVPLIKFHKGKGIYVRNTDKFCKAWKREKKRRAVGNCIVKNYNNGTLSIGGSSYGLSVSQNARKSDTCHPAGKNCSKASTHFRSGYTAITTALSTAQGNLTTKRSELATATTKCNRTCSQTETCADRREPTIPSHISDIEAYPHTLYRLAPGNAERGFAVNQCVACTFPRSHGRWGVCIAGCGSTSSPGYSSCRATCRANDNCSVQSRSVCCVPTICADERQRACNAKATLQTQVNNLQAQVTALTREKNCASPKRTAAESKANCISYVSTGSRFNKHSLSYSPTNGIVNCSSHITALPINFEDESLDNRCRSVQFLNPEYSFSFDGLTGRMGIKGGGQDWNWDKDANCISDTSKLHALPARCNDKYKNLVNLNNGFCNDDGVNYNSQTCAIP